jgi:hypothetical protein
MIAHEANVTRLLAELRRLRRDLTRRWHDVPEITELRYHIRRAEIDGGHGRLRPVVIANTSPVPTT